MELIGRIPVLMKREMNALSNLNISKAAHNPSYFLLMQHRCFREDFFFFKSTRINREPSYLFSG